MKKQICVCDHCGAEFNPSDGCSDIDVDDFDFYGTVDLCTECYQELCTMLRRFVKWGEE